jgi:hypothetical protein
MHLVTRANCTKRCPYWENDIIKMWLGLEKSHVIPGHKNI